MKRLAIIIVLLILAGCAAPKLAEQQAQAEQAAQPEDTAVNEASAAKAVSQEEAKKPSDIEAKLTSKGFEAVTGLSVLSGSRVTIVNEANTMHKLNGGDLFKSQFNTNIKSIYGSKDAMQRNKLAVGFVEKGYYEIKDLTSNTILKVMVE